MGLCRECKKPSATTSCEKCKKDRKDKRLELLRNKQCTSCTKPNENGKDQCDECGSKEYERYKKYRVTPEGRQRERRARLKYHYGISPEEYEELSALQDHLCEICRCEQGHRRKELYVDHDHKTGAIRGLLCHNCNSILGLAYELPELLRQAADYLEKYRKKETSDALD